MKNFALIGAAGYIDYEPQTPVDKGVANFVAWYKSFYANA